MTEQKSKQKKGKKCWNCKIDCETDSKTINIVYKLEGKPKRSWICQSDKCLNEFKLWTFHCSGCECSRCKKFIVGIGCYNCGNRASNKLWEIQSFIDTHNRATLQLFCSKKCYKSKSPKTICRYCGKINSTITCQICNSAQYCSEKCQLDDKSRHSKYCAIIGLKSHIKYTCAQCSKKSQTELLQCSGCKFARYCNKECQKKHWKNGHKKECKEISAGDS